MTKNEVKEVIPREGYLKDIIYFEDYTQEWREREKRTMRMEW